MAFDNSNCGQYVPVLFYDGQFIQAALLKGAINDPSGRVRIGQRYGGNK